MSVVWDRGAKDKRNGHVLVSEGCLLLRGRSIGRAVDVIHCRRRPQSKIARIIALYLTQPLTTVTLSILFQAQLTEQINMSFVLVVCCVV